MQILIPTFIIAAPLLAAWAAAATLRRYGHNIARAWRMEPLP